jgi:diguanylate cyclase (GGDEF)-like protein/PAS domain S-box-containing protein
VPRSIARPQVDAIQQFFDLSVDMLGTASADGRFTQLNPAWERCLGWSRDELMALSLVALVHPDDVEATRRQVILLAAPEGASVVAFENRCRTRGGDYRCLQWTTVAKDGVLYFVATDVTDRRAAEAEREVADRRIRRSEELHRTLAANLPDTSVFLLDHDLRILLAEGEAIRRMPWSGEDQFRGRKVTELFEIPDEVLRLSVTNYSAVLQGERRAFEFVSDGLTIAVQAVPVHAEDGTVESALVVVRDVTERSHAEQQIKRHARQQSAVAELARFALQSHDLEDLMAEAARVAAATLDGDGMAVMQLDDARDTLRIVAGAGLPNGYVGARGIPLAEAANAGYTARVGEPVIVEDMTTEKRFKPSPTMVALGMRSSLSVPIEGPDRSFGVLNVHAHEPRVFSDDEVAFLVAVAALITVAVERDRSEKATEHAAVHDPLTGLPNRTLALDRLELALARRQRERIEVAVFVLDVDRFKLINDSLGHAAGDEVLIALARRLSSAVRPSDTVARLGGDEFVIVCPDLEPVRGATEVAERLAQAINRALVLSSGEHFWTVSTGIALATSTHDTPESLLGDADAAMYRAKERGRGRYELFDEAMRTTVTKRIRTESELRRAIHHDELEVWFQPIVDLATGRTVSTEALVRWPHPDHGMIDPLEFIPIAEETGLILPLGLHVLEVACRQTAAWQTEFDSALGVSVNVSGRQAVSRVFPAQVAAIAERSGLRPGTLALEITETVLMDEADSPGTALGVLQEHGLTLTLDDFGTGYSSLSRLKRLPVDTLKIDRSFVAGLEDNADDRAIVKATIDMAHAVGLRVVAEGVETREQEEHLRRFGCELAQGYLYARPQPGPAATEVFAAAARE